jgi:hypothetical protein
MDGQVLQDAFDDQFNQANPIQVDDTGFGPNDEDSGLNSEDTDLVIERLKDLGYVA